ncbi:alcohol dehydrogenase catalytic domain-containing protein [Isoptericola cucumis]|uniref:alcohol dehydrogenase catalytic domain-containing protein n=1 Tax=Isoptericola cucumis TaxID=1776856 RepID=UPI0016670BCF|nr:zinc-binding alcohol dehydrogenase family protein [Isoptericola cucumis]
MRAAVLERFGSPLVVREQDDPVAHGGEVLVRVLATCILPYTAEVFSGRRRYPLVPPVVPGAGAVGRIVTVGPDATRLRAGDLVWCDPTVRSRDDARTPDVALQGLSSRGDGGARLAEHLHDGAFAELMRVPTENVYRLPEAAAQDPARWSTLTVHLVPYGGLHAVGLAAGETVVVSGASGNLGGAAVAVALAMGAGQVVAPGRNRFALDALVGRFGDRVRPVVLSGDEDADRAAVVAAADHPVDVVIDLLPPSAPSTVTRAAAMTVQEGGRVVLMGGVGMLGGPDLALPYPWLMRNSVTVRGQWLGSRTDNVAMIRMIASGVLDLGPETVTTFGLDDVNDAVAFASEHGGAFDRTVLVPG